MLRSSAVSLLFVGVLCTLGHAAPIIYSGTLTSNTGGITGVDGNAWLTGPGGSTLYWTVTDNTDGTYNYAYELKVPNKSRQISHLIIEVSPTFTASDLLSVTAGTVGADQPDSYPKASDVGMPSPMTGLKFDAGGAGSTAYDWTVSFLSDRAPKWGDFYAKDGVADGTNVAIWNAGFTAPDTDPTAPLQSGSLANHLLVPDTATGTIPAPGAVLLGSLGASLVSWLRRRRAL